MKGLGIMVISDAHAMDLLANMFRTPDWGDISMVEISEIIEATGRNIDEIDLNADEDIECNVCNTVYPNWMYIDVFQKPDGSFICEKCVPYE